MDEKNIIIRSSETGTRPARRETWLDRQVEALHNWTHDRPWYLYLPLAVWMGYITIRTVGDADYRSFIEGLNLGIHEFGHLLFTWAGQDVMVAGGTIAQVSAPLIAMGMFIRQKDYFAVLFAINWLGTNVVGVARYMADARAQELPLVSYAPGATIHDWEYMLSNLHLLQQDTAIAAVVRTGGIVLLIVSSLAAVYLIWEMLIHRFIHGAEQP